MKQSQHRLDRDGHRKLIRNVKAVIIELRDNKDYLNEALPFHAPGRTSRQIGNDLGKSRKKAPSRNLPFPDPECALAVTYQTLEAISKLPGPGDRSTYVPDFATPRDGLIVALGAWWLKHSGLSLSAKNPNTRFMRLCRYAMTDERLSSTVVKDALKDTRGRSEKFNALRGEAASWEHDPFEDN